MMRKIFASIWFVTFLLLAAQATEIDQAQKADNESYTIAKEITRKALNHQLKDKTNGALYFHHRKVIPDWSKKYIKTAEVEEFIFYKQANSKAK